MPLYEFRCPDGHDFEQFYRSIGTAAAEALCPECGALAQRRMSTTGLVFKGSGFYITDYGKDGKKAERDAASAKTGKAAAEGAGETGGSTAKDKAVKTDDKTTPAPATPAASPAGEKQGSSDKPSPQSAGSGKKGKPE